jgi:hypothetical protein
MVVEMTDVMMGRLREDVSLIRLSERDQNHNIRPPAIKRKT